MFKTVKSKFIFFSIFLILITTVVPVYFLIAQLHANFEARSIVMLDTTLDIVRYGLKFTMMSGRNDDLQNVINDFSKKTGIYHIRIFDNTGKINFASDKNEINKNISMVSTHTIDYKNLDKKVIDLETNDNIYTSTEPIFNEKPCQSCHSEKNIIAFLDIDTELTSPEIKFYTGSIHMFFLGLAVIIILLAGLYLIFNKFINSPLKRLVNALDNVQLGNLDEKIEINSNDEIGIVYKHFNDMTEKLKTSTDKIEQMHLEELQRLNRLKTLGELTSQTAHEVNNHIAIIMARADYLNLESKNIPELAKYNEDLQVLIDQTTKISEITGNILKYSRKKATELKEIDLIKTIDEFVTVYTPLLLKKNIKLITNCNLRKATIVGDSIQINQILTNLVMNAVDAIGNKGKIEFEIVENGTGKISLIINDDGPGISTNNLNEIFTPFFTTKSSQNNTGLGLYIVKKICENHSAEIRCESDRKRGTSFIISFNKIKKS